MPRRAARSRNRSTTCSVSGGNTVRYASPRSATVSSAAWACEASRPVVASSGSTTSSAPSAAAACTTSMTCWAKLAMSGSARNSNCTALTVSVDDDIATNLRRVEAVGELSGNLCGDLATLHLAGVGVARQLRHDDEPGGSLVARQRGRAMLQDLSLVESIDAGFEHHHRHHLLAVQRVGQSHDGGLSHRRVRQQHRLHLRRRDVRPTTDDHVAETTAHVHVATLVELDEIAGAVPAVI